MRTGDLARFRNGRIELFHYLHASSPDVHQVIINPDGSVFGASSIGLLGWRNGATGVLNRQNGLPCDEAFGAVWDRLEKLWVYSACGLFEIDHSEIERWWKEPQRQIQFHSFGVLDGVQPGRSYFNSASRSPDGSLWFANGGAVQEIAPERLDTNTVIPPVHVERVTADHRDYSVLHSIELPPRTKDIEIDYTALSFVVPQSVRFRYTLENSDSGWQDPGTRRQAFYANLPPGQYRFRVIACNNDGLWNTEGASVSFIVEPAFYQTFWFRIACLLSAAACLWTLYRFRVHHVVTKVREQLSVRLEERERIARELHDTLLQAFQGLTLKFQAVLKQIPKDLRAHEMLESALSRADEALIEGRRNIRDLRQASADPSDLQTALSTLGQTLTQEDGSSFALTVAGIPRPLASAAYREVLQIGREAITNAFHHAKAKRIEVQIEFERFRLRVVVRDDGVGMETSILKTGRTGRWGIVGMRERAQRIGAQIDIWSAINNGTEVDLSVPGHVIYQNTRTETGARA